MKTITTYLIISITLLTAMSCQLTTKNNENMMQNSKFISLAIEAAKDAKSKGNLPYGCILVDAANNVILTGENTINTDSDCLAHAEINLIREACRLYDYSFLNSCTIYTSDEPCGMCSSAIYWSGIGKLVFGLSKSKYYDTLGRENPNWVFELESEEVFKKGARKVEIAGPLMEEEVLKLHLEN